MSMPRNAPGRGHKGMPCQLTMQRLASASICAEMLLSICSGHSSCSAASSSCMQITCVAASAGACKLHQDGHCAPPAGLRCLRSVPFTCSGSDWVAPSDWECMCAAQVGISVNLIFLVVGIVVSSAVPPLAFLLTWRKVPRGAAITAALGGQAAAIIAWLVHTQVVYGAITQDTSQVRPCACWLQLKAPLLHALQE